MVFRCALFVVCCLLLSFVDFRCSLCITICSLFVVCCLLFGVVCLLAFVGVCCLVCDVSHVALGVLRCLFALCCRVCCVLLLCVVCCCLLVVRCSLWFVV